MSATVLEHQIETPIQERPPQPIETATRRVLHVINGEHYAGAEKVQDLLARRLPEHGFEVAFACVKPVKFATACQADVAIYETPMWSRFDLRPARKLAGIIERGGFDLVHTHTPRSALVGQLAARRAEVPLVHHVHGQTANVLTRAWLGKFNALIERHSTRKAAAVIAVSDSLAKHLQQTGWPKANIHVLPNGVETPEVRPTQRSPNGAWTIGTAALFRPRKGLEVLLTALSLVRSRGHNVRLVALGSFESPNYEAELKKLSRELGVEPHVEWPGFAADVEAQMRTWDLFVLPSLLSEGLPMVVIEAMAQGVPVVGTRVDGIIDVVEHQKTGLLAEPGNAGSLAAELRRVIKGEVAWHGLRRNGLVRQAERYSDKTMARDLAEVYREVLGANA